MPSHTRTSMTLLHTRWFDVAIWVLLLVLSAIMLFHSVALRTWGIGTFPSIDKHILAIPFDYTPLVDADGRPSFLRYARSPCKTRVDLATPSVFCVGRLLHVLPAGLWSLIAPFQLSPTFRAKHRTAHRRLGRLFIGMSVSMGLGAPFLILNKASKVHYGVLHGGATIITSTYFLVTGLLAINHARNKRMAAHRVWILRHVAIGHSVHMQRLMGISWGFMHLFFPEYRDHTQAASDLRSTIFATCVYACLPHRLTGGEQYHSAANSHISNGIGTLLSVVCFLAVDTATRWMGKAKRAAIDFSGYEDCVTLSMPLLRTTFDLWVAVALCVGSMEVWLRHTRGTKPRGSSSGVAVVDKKIS